MITDNEALILKDRLIRFCSEHIEGRIDAIKTSISMTQESANEETKSSAGDKYETGRAMMQIEMEQQLHQLNEANTLKEILLKIDPVAVHPSVQVGSLAITDEGNFFIAISVGQVKIEKQSFLVVSAQSPIGSKLIGKRAGDEITFANKRYKVLKVA